MTLTQYKKKRNFKNTPEPKGKIKSKKSSNLLYIIQKHDASHLHYDFRLELNGVLLSWAIPKGPCLDPNIKRLAIHVEDHPIEYGSFEGIIPKGQYGGGTVMLWDKGTWISQDKNAKEAYYQGRMKFILNGEKLKGLWNLVRINKVDKTWLLIKSKDAYAKKQIDITIEQPNSVLTHKNIDEIAKKHKKIKKQSKTIPTFNLKPSAIPQEFFPQLATYVDKPPIGEQWLHEIKFDGYRIIAIKSKGKTRLMSRNNIDWTHKFKSIAKAINHLPIRNIILDGEIVVFDENNKSNFQALQNSIKDNTLNTFYYYIFDLPYYDKYNLTHLTLLERKNLLKNILNDGNNNLLYSDHVLGSGTEILEKSCELSLEGIVSKDMTSPYLSQRTATWLKSKCIKRQEFVIGGYTHPKGARHHLGALLLGTYNKQGELIYNGNVGTGFTEESLDVLHKLLKKYAGSENPFTTRPPKIKQITWVKPILVAEIEFTEWTTGGHLRHPSFKGLRLDKKAKNVMKEVPIPVEDIAIKPKTKKVKIPFKLTHPHKILYPEDKITKEDIANYYENIQEWILPFVVNRPLTLVRCPAEYKKCFYQKHMTSNTDESIHAITIKEKNGKSEYVYIKDTAGLLGFPQLGVLEIHPWGSRIENVENPDMIVFDLDPSPELAWEKVVAAAKNVKKYLAKIKLKSFVKTTGGKGLHVVVPINPEYTWEEVKYFSKTFVELLTRQYPTEYVSKISKTERKGKIFIDYLRNQRGATAIAPYSTRARLHAPVATPLAWSELTHDFNDTFFTIKTLPLRLKKLKQDPWKDLFKIRQSLNFK